MAATTSTLASAGVALPQTAAARAVPVGIATLYHRGTLRGGQALHNLGNLVVIGDVNPGASWSPRATSSCSARCAGWRTPARRAIAVRASSRSSSRRPSCASPR